VILSIVCSVPRSVGGVPPHCETLVTSRLDSGVAIGPSAQPLTDTLTATSVAQRSIDAIERIPKRLRT
jgi:hypothetical protein